MKKTLALLAVFAASTLASNALGLRITEVMYTGLYGEFFELTNTNASGGASITTTNYKFSDSANDFVTAGKFVTLPSTTLAPGDSIVLTEADPGVFASVWYTLPSHTTPTTLKSTLGNVTVNLGRGDAIIIRNNIGTEIDRLTFDDAGSGNVKGPRSEDVSIVPSVTPGTDIPVDNASTWITSAGKNASGGTVTLPAGSATPWKSGNTAGNGTKGSPGVYIP